MSRWDAVFGLAIFGGLVFLAAIAIRDSVMIFASCMAALQGFSLVREFHLNRGRKAASKVNKAPASTP